MRLLFALIFLVLAGCASRPAEPRSTFAYPPPPNAPRVIDVTWPELIVVIKGGHVTAAHERHSPQVTRVSIDTDDGHVYRTTEPRPYAIHEAVQTYAPNPRIDFDFDEE